MADPNPIGTADGINPSSLRAEALLRYRLARAVVVGTFLAIFALVFALLVVAQQGNSIVQNVADKTFNTVLPVLAAWMGTVLAFYFSAQSQERTSASLETMINRATGATPPGTPVSQAMIAFASIRYPYDLSHRPPEDIPLDELKQRFQGNGGPPVTRLVFHANQTFRYVLHVGTLNQFLVKPPSTPPATKFEDLLKDPESLTQISKLIAFVRASATLADAKAALEAVPGAQDIIVTETGAPNDRMLGWLTNVDLTKHLTARS
jgi:hypothetical protein